MLFSTRIFEFKDMETIIFLDFLHLLNLIKINPNVNFGGKLRFAHICHKAFFSFFFFQGEWGKAHVDKHIPWLSFISAIGGVLIMPRKIQ
jgi:hypothetical protein